MTILTTKDELLNTDWLKSLNEQSTAGPLASKELKQAAIVEIDKYLEHSGHVDTMETVAAFCGTFEKDELDNILDATYLMNDLISYFLIPESCSIFSAKYCNYAGGYRLSEILPALREFFTELANDTSMATIRRDWLSRFAGGAEEKTVAGIVKMYTDKNTQHEAVHRAA